MDDDKERAISPPVIAIETHDLTRAFGDRTAVDKLTLSIPAGTVFGFLGPNGAGKTTTVRLLAALIAPTAGSAVVAGHVLGKDNRAIRRSVGILTESPGLYDRLTAEQNLTFFARLYELSSTTVRAQVERYLRMLGLWDRRHERVGTFSKGMRQKLAIARAVLHDPPIVFFDEPTSGLDPEASRVVRDFIKELRGEGRTIFLTTHNLPEADELCDQVGVFRTSLLRVDTPMRLRASLFGQGTDIRVAGDASAWIPTVEKLAFVRHVTSEGAVLRVSLDDPEGQNPPLIRALVEAGAPIRAVELTSYTLEDVYLKLLESQGGRSAVSSPNGKV